MNFKKVIVFLFLFLNFQTFANNDLQEAKNKLEDIKKEANELVNESFKLTDELEKIGDFNQYYNKLKQLKYYNKEDHKIVFKKSNEVFRNQNFLDIANEVLSDPNFNPKYDKELFFKLIKNSQNKIKRTELVNEDPKISSKNLRIFRILGLIKNPHFKHQIYYDIYAFSLNYQMRLNSLPPGSQESEDLRKSFIWGKNIFLKWLYSQPNQKIITEYRDQIRDYLESVASTKFSSPIEVGGFEKMDRNLCEVNCERGRNREPLAGRGGLNGNRELKPIPEPKPIGGLEGMLNRAGRNIDLRGNGQNEGILTNNENPYETELAQIIKEIDEYSVIISEMKNKIQEKLKNLGSIEERMESNRLKFKNSIISNFVNNFALQSLLEHPLITLLAINYSQSIEENPQKTDLLFSVFLDTPYDLANLFTAVAYDQTIFGEDASEVSDKVILGAITLIPGISHKVAKEGINFAKRMKKYGMEGLEKIAAKSSVKSVDEIIKVAEELGIEGADEIAKNTNILEAWEPHYKKFKIEDAAEVNARDFVGRGKEPAFHNGTKVFEFKTTQTVEFVRVHGPDNIIRPWMMKYEDIKGLNAEQIKIKFNLPEAPISISKVEIPIGTNMRIGAVGTNEFGGSFGATQFQVLDELKDFWFTRIGDL